MKLMLGLMYTLLTAEGTKCDAYFYHNEDAGCDGFGFNLADGGGFLPHSHVAIETKITMTFGQAIEAMKKGHKVARAGWNGKGMWLIMCPSISNVSPVAGTPYSKAGINHEVDILSHIDMYTVNSEGRRAMLPGWLASQTDMVSEDWRIIE